MKPRHWIARAYSISIEWLRFAGLNSEEKVTRLKVYQKVHLKASFTILLIATKGLGVLKEIPEYARFFFWIYTVENLPK